MQYAVNDINEIRKYFSEYGRVVCKDTLKWSMTVKTILIVWTMQSHKYISILIVLGIAYFSFLDTHNTSLRTRVWTSVTTKIENGPKTNTKILRFLKIDQRRIRRIFVNSKILRKSSKIWRFSKENEKFSLLKIFFQAATWTNFPSSRL